MKFVHLHVHTHYSLLDGLTKIDELIETAKNEGSPAVAITDHGTMYGVIEFYQKAKKAGIKPIIGVETYMAPSSRFDKKTKDDEKKMYHLVLLAKDNVGYKNLIKLTSIAHLEGFYYKPRIDWEVLSAHKEGLIALTACIGGEIPYLIRVGKKEEAKKRAIEFKNLFGEGNFYFELQYHPNLENQLFINETLLEFSRELDIPVVATNDVHYLRKEDNEAQDILLCMQNKKKRTDSNRMNMMENDFSMRSSQTMIENFKDLPEAIENSVKIAEKCNVEIELGNIQLPYFDVPDGFSEYSYLEKLAYDGLDKRFGKNYENMDDNYKERLDYELSVIKKMGWPSYFLIVADFVNWAKSNGILVGPGRGSAAGSLLCYVIGITDIDPIKYDLLFERFLNPERVSMPDIDLDFADVRRSEVIKYVEEKYGKEKVAQIITFGTMAARAAVKDVGRVLDVPYDLCDELSKAIPMFSTIEKALENAPDFREKYEKNPTAKMIIDYARRLEGVARHCSTHACGVLITKNNLTDYAPVQYAVSEGTNKALVSQYSLGPVEALGLLKMDFLGLKNLTIIESAINIIKGTQKIEVDISKIPLDDKETYELFARGDTTGVFQFESSGMKRYLKELKPSEFEDIIAMVALYRPGPMEWIPEYIAGKHGTKRIEYLHKKLEPILKNTYGVAIYQEQVMRMARDLAGFTMGEADVLRKAMGKKIVKLLEEQKQKFYDGCVLNGIELNLAKKIFSFIEPFAGYGFNRSHAACYALVAYQTAYLKAHWPVEFMASLLTADQQNIDRIAVEIEECSRMGIEVSRPDINQSFRLFTVVNADKTKKQVKDGKVIIPRDTIRFGLNAIKNVGEHISRVIIEERKANGFYKDISDLLERVNDKDMNKKTLEALAKCGALDDFEDRGVLLSNVENMLNYNKEIAKQVNNKQVSLFSNTKEPLLSSKIKLELKPKATRQEKLAWEKELLGLYLTEHPYVDYKERLSAYVTPIKNIASLENDYQVTVAGIITRMQKIITKNGKNMLFVTLEDDSRNVEVLIFPNLYAQNFQIWKEGCAVLVQGKISDKDQDKKILANTALDINLKKIDEVVSKLQNAEFGSAQGVSREFNMKKDLTISLNKNLDNLAMNKLKEIFEKYKGGNKVFFEVKINERTKILETNYQVNHTSYLITELKNRFRDLIVIK